MNHCVPDWDLEDSPIPSSSGFSRAVDKKTAMPDDELVELLWRNGQVVMHSQTQRSLRKSPVTFSGENDVLPGRPEKFISNHREDIESATNHLFIQEDEMASWLCYPLDDSFEREFCPDLFNPIQGSTPGNFSGGRNHQTGAEPRAVSDPPIGGKDKAVAAVALANTEKMVPESSRPLNFLHLSLPTMSKRGFPAKAKAEVSRIAARESRVDPNEIPTMGSGNYSSFLPQSRVSGRELRGISASTACDVSVNVSGVEKVRGEVRKGGVSKRVVTETEFPSCDTIEATFTSSSRGSGGRGDRNVNSAVDDRKRKAREADESECQSEDMEFESMDPTKVGRQSTSTRRTRAAEVHNLSERRRRDRINEKMKALQKLIPRSNKSDKASMLDEVIDYLKSLQLQVQIMSMGSSMPPMMFPGVQHYMPSMNLGMSMGMSMDMGMPVGLNRPILSFPQVLPNSAMPGSAPPHLAPRIPMLAFHLPSISQADQSQLQPTNRLDPPLNFVSLQNLNQMQMPNFVDPYQHYLHTTHVPPPQNQVTAQPSSGKGAKTPNNNSG